MTTDRRPRFTTALAALALAVAMTGTAYAAGTVATSDLQDGAVTAPKLAAGAVRTGKLRDEAIIDTKIAPGAVLNGHLGAASVTGSKIALGSVGSSAISGDSVRASELGPITEANSAGVTIVGGQSQTATIDCPAGSQVISGGHYANHTQVYNVSSRRSGNGWYVRFRNTDDEVHQIFVYAYCLNV